MKPAFFFLALAGCTMERPQPISEPDSTEQPWFCEDYEAEGEEAPKGCVREPGRDSPCKFLRRFVKEAPHLAAVIRAANEVDVIIDNLDLSGNGEDVIVGLTMEAEEILKGADCD